MRRDGAVKLVVVADGTPRLYGRGVEYYGDGVFTVISYNDENFGLLASRICEVTLAARVVAFINDLITDVVWAEWLARDYAELNAIVAIRKMVPEWAAGEPSVSSRGVLLAGRHDTQKARGRTGRGAERPTIERPVPGGRILEAGGV